MKKLFLFLFLSACKFDPVPVTTPPVLPPSEIEYKAFWLNKDFTKELVKALDIHGGSLLSYSPTDAKEWCFDKYKDKKQFYITLISAMSKYESAFNPNTFYKESFNDAKGNPVMSVGLMQVSSESCAGYGMPYLKSDILKENKNNLECTVRILARWIPRDTVISQGTRGAGRYWSVIRTGSTHHREKIKAMVCSAI